MPVTRKREHIPSGNWTVTLLDDDVDGDADVGFLIRSNRGGGLNSARHNSEYRRSNRYVEDGYGEHDFS